MQLSLGFEIQMLNRLYMSVYCYYNEEEMLNISTGATTWLLLYYNPCNIGPIYDYVKIISVRISCEGVSLSTKF
jgi:hypothetical protein